MPALLSARNTRAHATGSTPVDSTRTGSALALPSQHNSLHSRALDYLSRFGETHAFSHLTAARMWGCPLPGDPFAEPLHVTARRTLRGRPPGVVGHRPTSAMRTTRRGPFVVTDPASTWLALAATQPVAELVASGDYLTHTPSTHRALVTLDELSTRASTFHGRGARRARFALALINPAAESRAQSLLRLLLWKGGMPAPEINAEIRDAAGQLHLRGAMVFPQHAVLVDFDEHPQLSDTVHADRIAAMQRAGWLVITVGLRGLYATPDATLARITAALRSRGWRR